MEFGNIGNNYVSHGFFQMLRRSLPQSKIISTLQFSNEFKHRYQIETTPLDVFLDDLSNAERENAEARRRSRRATNLPKDNNGFTSEYLELLDEVELVLDLSGDIWGDNALFLGSSRFRVALLKLQTAQILGKKTALVASSPGPFMTLGEGDLSLAKSVYASFDLVLNREAQSIAVAEQAGFDVTRTVSLACPSVLFNWSDHLESRRDSREVKELKIGISICGWNFPNGPFDKEPRDSREFQPFVKIIELVLSNTEASIILFSHSNGFSKAGSQTNHMHGRDFVLAERLYAELISSGLAERVQLSRTFRSAQETHTFIGELDVLIAGRAHAAIAALTQGVPTIVLDYGHGPTAHKTRGFLGLYGQEEFLVGAVHSEKFEQTLKQVWAKRIELSELLRNEHVSVVSLVNQMGDSISILAHSDLEAPA